MDDAPPTACPAGRFVLPGLLLFSLLATAALLYPFPALRDSALGQAWMDAGHFPLFLGWQWLLTAVLAGRVRGAALVSAVTLVLLAGLVEIVQGQVGRSLSLSDWLHGVAGVACAALLPSPLHRHRRRVWLLATLALATLFTEPALRESLRWQQDLRQFPRLLDASSSRLPLFWSPLPSDGPASATLTPGWCDGQPCLTVQPLPLTYSGLSRAVNAGDWRPFRHLRLQLRCPRPLTLLVRIDDDRPAPGLSERFNAERTCAGEQQTLVLPLTGASGVGAAIDIARVRRLALFTAPAPAPASFQLLRVELE